MDPNLRATLPALFPARLSMPMRQNKAVLKQAGRVADGHFCSHSELIVLRVYSTGKSVG